jgi:hypothetical protein
MSQALKVFRYPRRALRAVWWHCFQKKTVARQQEAARRAILMKEYPIVRGLGEPTSKRGRALLDFIVDPFLPGFSESHGRTHGNFWKTRAIVKCLADEGFQVDVTDWRNMHAPLAEDYDLVIGQGKAFEASCQGSLRTIPKIFLGWGLYPEATKVAVEFRAKELQSRRGFRILQSHDVDHGALLATDIIYVGNQHTRDSYLAVTKVPAYAVPNPVVEGVRSTTEVKNYESARNKFMWMAAYGTLRRSLDVVLEVFAENPEFELWICGDISHEKEFFSAYQHEILHTANIHYQGWVDVATEAYRDVTTTCGYIIYPSVSDGMPGSVVNAMASGVLPIVTESAGMECGGLGKIIPQIDKQSILRILRDAASISPAHLKQSSEETSAFAADFYSQKAFRAEFADALQRILARHGI